jgi:hypothetical protein
MDHAPHLKAGERVISVSLSEADWQAFVRSTPQPVNWLKQRIQEAITASAAATAATSTKS